MKRFKTIAVLLATVTALAFASPVLAVNQGQIEGGDIYRIKNITKNVDFIDPANADACNVLMYKVRIHDPGPGALTNVFVWVDLPSGEATSNTSTIVVSSPNADPSSTYDAATVNLSSSRSVSYLSGTTQLLGPSGNVISNLPDGITQGGINIGDVGVSVDNRRYVQFQAKVSCPPVTPTPPVATPAKAVVATGAKALPNTGPGEVAGLFVGTSALGTAGHYLVARRRR